MQVSALYALQHCETFWSSASEKLNVKQSCRETGLNTDLCTCCQCEGFQHDNNLLWIFSCQKKKINWVSTVNCSKWRHSHQGRQLTLRVMLRRYTTLITESALAVCSTLFSICSLRRLELSPVILCLVLICFTDSEHYSKLFHFYTNIYKWMVLCLKMPHNLLSYPASAT